jgi:hypothetical protein
MSVGIKPPQLELDRLRKAVSPERRRVRVELFSAQERWGVKEVQRLLDRWLGVEL